MIFFSQKSLQKRCAIILFFFLRCFLFAEEDDDDETEKEIDPIQNKITEIIVTGLKKTKPWVAEEALEKFLGRDIDTLNQDEVIAAILDTGILDYKSTYITNSDNRKGMALVVDVRDKWSILPLPFFTAGSEQVIFGAAFFNANTFGSNDKTIVSFMYSPEGTLSTSAIYKHKNRKQLPSWNIGAHYSSSTIKQTTTDGDIYRRYGLDTISLNGGLSYPLLDYFEVALNTFFENNKFKKIENIINAPTNIFKNAITFSPSLQARQTKWDGYFLSEQKISLTEYTKLAFDGYPDAAFNLKINYERPSFKDKIKGFRLIGQSGLHFTVPSVHHYEFPESVSETNILPADYTAQAYAGLSLGAEKSVYRFKAITSSVVFKYQAVFSNNEQLGFSFKHGLATGACFYIKNQSTPAVSFIYTYSASYSSFAFSLGMSF
jgi:hypothetical protein